MIIVLILSEILRFDENKIWERSLVQAIDIEECLNVVIVADVCWFNLPEQKPGIWKIVVIDLPFLVPFTQPSENRVLPLMQIPDRIYFLPLCFGHLHFPT